MLLCAAGLLIATMYGVSSSSSGSGDADGEPGPGAAAAMEGEAGQPRPQRPDPEAVEVLRDKVGRGSRKPFDSFLRRFHCLDWPYVGHVGVFLAHTLLACPASTAAPTLHCAANQHSNPATPPARVSPRRIPLYVSPFHAHTHTHTHTQLTDAHTHTHINININTHIHAQVLPSLHAGLEDYTTDNRGDVGSWVREAAMAVLEPAVRALAAAAEAAEAAAPSSGGAQSAEASAMLAGKLRLRSVDRSVCRGTDSDVGVQAWVGVTARTITHAASSPPPRFPPHPTADVSGRAVGVLLRQSVERIGRLREAALRHVRRLLADPLVRPHVPHAAAVAAAVAAAAEAAEAGGVSASLEALQRVVVQLLPVAPYTGHLLEGLAASIGGVDNSLAKVASAALLEALASAGASGVGGAEVAAADGVTGASESGSGSGSGQAAQAALVAAVCGHLLDIWSRHAKSPRMATPLLRTALLLLTKAPGAADTLLPRPPPPAPPAQAAEAGSAAPAATSTSAGGVGSSAPGGLQSRWVDHLVEAARAETRGCGDVARLVEAAAVLAHLAVVPPAAAAAAAAAGAAGGGGGGHCRSSALQGLLVLLCSRYPKVRAAAREPGGPSGPGGW